MDIVFAFCLKLLFNIALSNNYIKSYPIISPIYRKSHTEKNELTTRGDVNITERSFSLFERNGSHEIAIFL